MSYTKKTSRKQYRQKRTRRHYMSGGDQLPLSHFSQSFKYLEEYNALSESEKIYYEKSVVIPLATALIKKIAEQSSNDDKLYYTTIIFINIVPQLLSTISSNSSFRNVIKTKLNELSSIEYVKEYGSPELFESFDRINQYIQTIDTISTETILSLISENNVEQLRKLFYVNKFLTLFKTDLTISYAMFYGSDEMVHLLRDLFRTLYLIDLKPRIITNIINLEYDKTEFKRHIDILNLTVFDMHDIFEYMNKQKQKDKLVYYLDAVKPQNLYTIVDPRILSTEYRELIVNKIYEINAPMNTVKFRYFIYCIYDDESKSTNTFEKTKHAIDFFLRNIDVDINTEISSLMETVFLGIKRYEISDYTLDQIIKKHSVNIRPVMDILLSYCIRSKRIALVKKIIEVGVHTIHNIDKGVEDAITIGANDIVEYLKSHRPPEPALMQLLVSPTDSDDVVMETIEEGNVVALLDSQYPDQRIVKRKANAPKNTPGWNYLKKTRMNPLTRQPINPNILELRKAVVGPSMTGGRSHKSRRTHKKRK